jgi:Flp pilus assembly pilin Flp
MKLMKTIKRFVKDERGLEGSEYALLLALICLAILVAITALSGAIASAFNRVTSVIQESVDNSNT